MYFCQLFILQMAKRFHTAALAIGSAVIMACACLNAEAQEIKSVQETIGMIAGNPSLADAVVGIYAEWGDGRPVADINSRTMLIPASNMKLITTGASIHALGPDFRFYTSIGHDGIIRDGVLDGNLYITGGGDPTLASKDSIATDINVIFRQWEEMIRRAGIRKIEGRIIGDGRYLDGMAEEASWLISDAGTYYGTGVTGLMFYENMMSFSVSGGREVGSPVNIEPYYPETPWMEFRYNCTTGQKGTGDLLYMYTNELAPVAEIRGTFGVDRGHKRVDCSNKFPEYTCAYYFLNYLKKRGIPCSGGCGDFKLDRTWEAKGEVTLIDSTTSPSLSRIVFETNHASNNVYAETLMRTLGRTTTGSACYDSSYVAMDKVLKKMGLNPKGIRIQDGSGLSRQNLVSAHFFCSFLKNMMSSPHFEEYVGSLPSPGKDGTMQYNMKNYPAAMRERIKVKSGSMNGVRCYSGYIIPTEGCKEDTIIFSIMVNNCTAPTWKVRPLLDKIMGILAGMN